MKRPTRQERRQARFAEFWDARHALANANDVTNHDTHLADPDGPVHTGMGDEQFEEQSDYVDMPEPRVTHTLVLASGFTPNTKVVPVHGYLVGGDFFTNEGDARVEGTRRALIAAAVETIQVKDPGRLLQFCEECPDEIRSYLDALDFQAEKARSEDEARAIDEARDEARVGVDHKDD